MSTIEFQHIKKKYEGNDTYSVSDFNLTINDGEFIVFVGPSGCGKSTTLRMVAGLEDISKGQLIIDDVVMNDVHPKDRGIAMVFQNYALFPFLNVYDNIGFGLKIRHMDKGERDRRIKEAAELLGLSPYLDKKPGELSGGQSQRVALGRAIVNQAGIFLMDEPLSNLDAKLRGAMREELVRLHNQVGATTIYVTHDQIEAMTMADRIVILRDGHIQQIGTPEDVYQNPANLFVASFIGTPPMNLLPGSVRDGKLYVTDDVMVSDAPGLEGYNGQAVMVGFRPEAAKLTGEGIEFVVEMVELLGAEYNIHGTLGGAHVIVRADAGTCRYRAGDHLKLDLKAKDLFFFDPDTGLRLEVNRGV
ncbi:sn-glycerol-3-phosphate ABC transporter ATP-binding protein UgpC [Peptoniphilus equinus]|uniref:Sn-glycerol-3-phosphate ABC transporter ATP-binding protein UgpC n=1 Tax=Peptoniphilus equinus TaxID=3016343 RepID=A0ABY7QTM7_9FIRM|nr:sn-glycerol-3-phosphate ABC transporter ATP-binding protein UgpC [Peptoniphilus equinus]WBW49811.1 sn-glycerol-3-phosphate ABC transporter ATP-binding protein UgpC [Peptoniphilus equinus]